MCLPVLAIPTWLDSHQFLALWIEGIALLLIFIWDRFDSAGQHKQTLEQIEVMQRSADASKDAAIAAKASADAIVNVERPWLLVTRINYIVLPKSQPSGENQNTSLMHVTVKNFGKSPAWLTNHGGTFTTVPKDKDLPREPVYRTLEPLETWGFVLTPGEEKTYLEIPHDTKTMVNDEFTDALEGRLKWFVFGFINYRDSFEHVRETRFCYILSRSHQFIASDAPPKYNQHT
jgi:hypothetical protein